MTAVARRSLGTSRTLVTALLLAFAALLVVTLIAATGSGELATDFRGSYLQAAESLRVDGSPYSFEGPLPYLYTPVLAELLVPLTVLPLELASFLRFVAAFAAVMGALALVGVRDVRCFAAVILWAPTWNSLETANITATIAFLVALVWRFRDDPWPAAGALGGALAVKLFVWPLLVWGAATRRSRTALVSVAVGVALVLASWAVVGFAGLTSYPDRLRGIPFEESYSLVGMLAALEFDPVVGRVAMALLGGLLLAATVSLGRRGADARAFACSVVATLALTPVLWLHYLVLLAVPLAVTRPRFGLLWLLPVVLWVCPRSGNGDGLQPFVPAAVVALILLAIVVRPAPVSRPSESTA